MHLGDTAHTLKLARSAPLILNFHNTMTTRQLRPRRGKSAEPNGDLQLVENMQQQTLTNALLGSQSAYPIGKHDGNNFHLPAALIAKATQTKQQKRSNPLHVKIYDWLYLQYLRYEVTTGLYMLVFWEKCILSTFSVKLDERG